MSMMMNHTPQVRWLNHSSLPDGDVSLGMMGVTAQVHDDFAPYWHTACMEVLGGTPLPTDWVVEILDVADVRNALGYHELIDGRPWMKVFQKTCEDNGVSWTSCASHEVLEGLADPYVDLAVQTARRTFTALEVCDPCETRLYTVEGVEVSDFVTPRWFDDTASVFDTYDFLGLIHHPLELLTGGYIGQWRPASGWTTRNAEGAMVREHRKRREVYEDDDD